MTPNNSCLQNIILTKTYALIYLVMHSMQTSNIFIACLVFFSVKTTFKSIYALDCSMIWLLNDLHSWVIFSVVLQQGLLSHMNRIKCKIFGILSGKSNGDFKVSNSLQGSTSTLRYSIFELDSSTFLIISSAKDRNCLTQVDCTAIRMLQMYLMPSLFS